MIHDAVSVFDSKSGVFSPPMTYRSVGAACRQFEDEINRADQSNPLYQHPDDYQLWKLGTFDDVSGDFVPDRSLIAQGSQVAVRIAVGS